MIFDKIIQTKEQRPMLNYLHSKTREKFAQEYYQINKKIRTEYMYRRSPETQLVIDGHARDIMGNYHFEPYKKSSSGKILVNRANNFAIKSRYRKKRYEWIKDALKTGEGFMFISKLAKDYANMMKQEFRKIDPSFDEDYFSVRSIESVASTTMAVEYNDYHVTGYRQAKYTTMTGISNDVFFPKDSIMHLTFDSNAGEVEGWTPLFGLPLHLELLWLMWCNQYDLQEKGNHPDLVVMSEKLKQNGTAFEQLRQDLESYNMPGNSKHGTLLLSGADFSIQQLERMDTLQFKEVGMFIQSLVAGAFHYPQSRLSIKTEQSAKSKDSSGGNEKFYYKIVSQKQDMLTELENSLLWIPYFGVELVQDKSYTHDQIEEGTAQQIRLGNMNTAMQMLNSLGKVVEPQKIVDYFNGVDMNIEEDDIIDGELKSIASSTTNDRLANDTASSNGMSVSDRREKRQEELNREKVDGKPNGVTR